MTHKPPEPVAELSTIRVASGSSARLGALTLAVVLVGFVGFVVVNKAPTPVAQVAQATATTGWLQTPAPTNPPLIDDGSDYSFAAMVQITGGALRAPLDRQVAESYGGELVIDTRDVGAVANVQIGRQRLDPPSYESFAAWAVDLERLRDSAGGQVVLLVAHVPPDLTSAAPASIAGGYTFTVLGRREGTRMTLFMEFVYPASSDFVVLSSTR
jgi:hypothetical protein